jgi:hypothetical protein
LPLPRRRPRLQPARTTGSAHLPLGRYLAAAHDFITAATDFLAAGDISDRPSVTPRRGYVVGMMPKAIALLTEIQKLADPAGLVSELPLFDVTDGSSEELKDLLEALEKEGFIEREASDFVRLTARGIAAAHGR